MPTAARIWLSTAYGFHNGGRPTAAPNRNICFAFGVWGTQHTSPRSRALISDFATPMRAVGRPLLIVFCSHMFVRVGIYSTI